MFLRIARNAVMPSSLAAGARGRSPTGSASPDLDSNLLVADEPKVAELTRRASNASPAERVETLLQRDGKSETAPPEDSTRKTSRLRAVAGISMASSRLSRACTTKLDLNTSIRQRSSVKEEPATSFEEVLHGIWSRADAFQQDKKLITRQIRDRDKRIINPRTSRWMPYWDFTSFAALFFTAVATPIEVCFVNDGEVSWFTINLLVNFFFFVDLIMNFFMAYQVAPNKGGTWVTDRHTIVRHYLSTWFVIDLLTVIDFQLIGKGVSGKPIVCGSMVGIDCWKAEDASASGTGTLRLIRTLRLLRLVSLLRR